MKAASAVYCFCWIRPLELEVRHTPVPVFVPFDFKKYVFQVIYALFCLGCDCCDCIGGGFGTAEPLRNKARRFAHTLLLKGAYKILFVTIVKFWIWWGTHVLCKCVTTTNQLSGECTEFKTVNEPIIRLWQEKKSPRYFFPTRMERHY